MVTGKLEVICGPMFSGKTEELLRRIKRAEIGGRPFYLVKPDLDSRYSKDKVASHSGIRKECYVRNTEGLETMFKSVEPCLIGIDEVQFYGDRLVQILEDLLKRGFRIVVAGLDMDSEAKPFGPLPQLMAIANSVDKLTAVCSMCGEDATHTFRKSANPAQILVGASVEYEARCRSHWYSGRG
jgi:thymidine kinase